MEEQLLALTYGQRLRYGRKSRGWTRDQLAEMLGVYKTYIGRWERDEVIPSDTNQKSLRELFRGAIIGLISGFPPNGGKHLFPKRNGTELFSRQLKHERELKGWSQAELAQTLGVHYSNVNRWERGETLPLHEYWQKLTEVFGKTVEELGLVLSVPEREATADTSHNYGQRLKYHRKLKAWSQVDLAYEVGTTPRSVVRWERSETLPELRFQQRLCELFGKDPEELGFVLEQTELTGANSLPVDRDRTPNVLLLRQRRARGWTQRDVAEKIGTYPMNISKWERGETHPEQDFQQKLCELFQCKYEDLELLQSLQAQAKF